MKRALAAWAVWAALAGPAAAGQVTKLPALVSFVAAEYPPAELAAGRGAVVELGIVVAADGSVSEVTVLASGGADFDAAALAAARHFVFLPAEVDGLPSPVKTRYRYVFTPPAPAPPAPAPAPPSRPRSGPARDAGAYQTTVLGRRVRAELVAVAVRAEDARSLPGTQGDALKVVEVLPGVARPSLGSGRLVIWGAAPEDTQVELDGVQLAALYHLGGLRSTVSSDLVASVTLLPGGFGADHGRALGGLVTIETRELPSEGVHGHLAVNLLDASALLSAVRGRTRVALAGRYSYLDRLLGGALGDTARELFPIPRYGDYQAMLEQPLRDGETLTALLVGSHDLLERSFGAQDPAELESERTRSDFQRLLVRYTRDLPGGASVLVTPSLGRDDSETRLRFGATPAQLDVQALRYAVRAAYRAPVTRALALALGLDAAGVASQVSRVGSLTSPPREGDLTVFGQPPPGDVSADAWTAEIVDVAPYAQLECNLGPFTLTPGLRLDALAIGGNLASPRSPGQPPVGYSRLAFSLDPRLAVTWRAGSRLKLGVSAGRYHQPPAPEDLSAVFGNPTLGPSRASHLVAHALVHPGRGLELELTGFYKQLDALTIRSAAPDPLVAQALVGDGEGRSYGAQLLVRRALTAHLLGWLSYGVSRSQRRSPGQAYRLFDYDQTHVLAVVGSYAWHSWSFGARFRYSTGLPRTPAFGSFYDAASDRFEPILGAQNSIRVPAFAQLDARVERRFRRGGSELSLYLDVENLTARRNAEELVYSDDFTRRGALTGMPTLAVLGARLDF